MTVSQLKRPFLKELDAVLRDSGFRRSSDQFHGDRYSRESDRLRQTIHVSLVPRADALVIEVPFVSLRYDAVEETIARYEDPDPLLTPTDRAERPTLTVPLEPSGLIRGLFRKSWSVRKQEDIPRVAVEVGRYALEKGQPAFATLSNPQSALQVLVSDDEKARTYAAPDEMRAKKAICVALIFESREAAKLIAEAKLRILSGDARSAVNLWFKRLWRDEQHESGEHVPGREP